MTPLLTPQRFYLFLRLSVFAALVALFGMVPICQAAGNCEDGNAMVRDKEKFPWADAIRSHNFERVQELIQNGPAINVLDADGFAPLHWAARDGSTEIARLLIEAGADVNHRAADSEAFPGGWTPLHFAANQCDAHMLEMLLEQGADPNVKIEKGFSGIFLAAHCETPEAVGLFLERGLDPNTVNDVGVTPIMCSINEKVLDFFIKHGGDPRRVAKNQVTLLQFACMPCNLDLVKYLFKENIYSKNDRDVLGVVLERTAATEFMNRGPDGVGVECMDVLLSNGAPVDYIIIEGEYRYTPLLAAVSMGGNAALRKLMEYKPDCSIKNHRGQTPMDIAVKNDDQEAIGILNKYCEK